MRGIVYDSGVGGLAAFSRIARAGWARRLEYFAGVEHMPYGEKSASQLSEIVNADVAALLASGADFVLIACNTACTALCADFLADSRVLKISDLTAALAARAQPNSLLLCTRASLSSGLFKAPERGHIAAVAHLAEFVERADFTAAAEQIARIRQQFASVREVIAGCTHFGLLRAEFAAEGFALLDPVDDLARIFSKNFGDKFGEKFADKLSASAGGERAANACELGFYQPQMEKYFKEHQCRF